MQSRLRCCGSGERSTLRLAAGTQDLLEKRRLPRLLLLHRRASSVLLLPTTTPCLALVLPLEWSLLFSTFSTPVSLLKHHHPGQGYRRSDVVCPTVVSPATTLTGRGPSLPSPQTPPVLLATTASGGLVASIPHHHPRVYRIQLPRGGQPPGLAVAEDRHLLLSSPPPRSAGLARRQLPRSPTPTKKPVHTHRHLSLPSRLVLSPRPLPPLLAFPFTPQCAPGLVLPALRPAFPLRYADLAVQNPLITSRGRRRFRQGWLCPCAPHCFRRAAVKDYNRGSDRMEALVPKEA